MAAHALYIARIMHRRPGAPRYRFGYRAWYLLLDIDAIDAACAATPLLSRNRFNWLSFHDADHGPHDGSPLRPWLEALLADRGVTLAGGRVRLLAMPRVLGYGFNPLSLFYCEHADGGLRAIVAQVHNTFGEHHFYVLHADGAAMGSRVTADKAKRFHVSPFLDRDGRYRFHFLYPDERLGVGIRLYDDSGQTLRIATTLTGERRPLTTAALLRAALAQPLLPFKVIAAIHWQALKLWLRGAGYRPKPKPHDSNVS